MQYHNTDANSQLYIKENLHVGAWKSDLHFEEDVSVDFKQNQTPRSAPCV